MGGAAVKGSSPNEGRNLGALKDGKLKIQQPSENLVTDGNEVMFKWQPIDFRKDTFFTSRSFRLKARQNLTVNVKGAAVVRIGILSEEPQLEDFEQSALFETEDGFGTGSAKRRIFLNDINYLCYGEPGAEREYLEINPNEALWLYIIVLFGSPTISATIEHYAVTWKSFDDTNIGITDSYDEAVCGLVKAAEQCIMVDKIEHGHTYLLRWKMGVKQIARKIPEYGFIRLGLLDTTVDTFTPKDFGDSSFVWFSESAVRTYPYSGTIALAVDTLEGCITHNLLESSVGNTVKITLPTDSLTSANLRLIVELSSGTLSIKHGHGLPVQQPFGSVVYVENNNEVHSQRELHYVLAGTGYEPRRIIYGADPTSFVVEFNEKIQSQDIKNKTEIKGKLKSLDETASIQVIATEDSLTEHDMQSFFSDERRCGGDNIKSLTRSNTVKRSWIVLYESADVARNVCKSMEYLIDGSPVQVLPYYKELGCAVNNGDKPLYDREPLTVSENRFDPDKIRFIKERTSEKEKLEKFMRESVAVHVVWSDARDDDDDQADIITVECEIPDKDYKKLTDWKDRSISTLQTFIADRIHTKTVLVEPKVWEQSMALTDRLTGTYGMHFVSDESSHTIKLVSSNQNNLDKIAIEVGKIVPPVERKSEKLTKGQSEKYLALEAENMDSQLSKDCRNTRFSVNREKIEVTITGPVTEVDKVKTELLRLSMDVKRVSVHVTMESEHVGRKAKQLLSCELKKFGLNQDVKISNRSISVLVYCPDSQSEKNKTSRVQKAIEAVIKEQNLDIKDESLSMFSTDMWRTFKDDVEEAYNTKMKYQSLTKSLKICASQSHIEEVKDKVETFLEQHSRGVETVEVSQDVSEYMAFHVLPKYSPRGIISLQQRGDEYTGKVMIRGNNKEKEDAKNVIVSEGKCIKSHWFILSKPWLSMVIEDIPINRIITECTSLISVENRHSLAEKGVTAIGVVKTVGVSIQAIQADITQLCVDVIVTPAAPDLNMDSRVAQAILHAGGRIIQTEGADYVKQHGNIAEGGAISTSAGSLPSRFIFHVVGPQKKKGDRGQSALFKSCINKLLEMAETRGLATIAIPMLSYGNDRYPIDLACEHTLEAVTGHFQTGKKTSLTTVYLCDVSSDVVVKLANHMQAHSAKGNLIIFRHKKPLADIEYAQRPSSNRPKSAASKANEFAWAIRRGGGHSHTIKWTGTSPLEEQNESEDDDDNDQSNIQQRQVFSGGLPYRINITDKLRLHVVKGTIENQQVDVIVCPTFQFPDINGAVANAIKKAAGDGLVQQCKNISTLEMGQVKRTSGGSLKCKHVYHVKIDTDWSDQTYTRLTKLVHGCLRDASQYQCKSVAFPTFGTGHSHYPADKVAKAVVESVCTFASKNPSTTITDVNFVVFYGDQSIIKVFETCIPTLFNSDQNRRKSPRPKQGTNRQQGPGQGQNDGKHHRRKQARGSGNHSVEDDTVVFKVVSKVPRDVQKAIEKSVENEFITEEIQFQFEDKEDHLSTQENTLLENLAAKHAINIQIDGKSQPPRLKLFGHQKGVKAAKPRLQDMVIRQFPDVRLKSKMAKNIANHVQWLYDDHGTLKEVPSECLLDIHFGYLKREDFTYKNGSTEYQVILQTLEEHPVHQKGKKRQLYLRNKMTKNVELPDNWSIKTSGAESSVEDLSPSDSEFNEVKKKFLAAGCKPTQIMKISRIENKYMWRQYQSKKSQLQVQNPKNVQNERELWHGTDSATTHIITRKGYDRSFCGKNATFFGCGVYFAVESSYSDRYAHKDPNGIKRMFLNSVLTGAYTLGKEDHKFLPPKTTSSTEIVLYDSGVDNVKNPSMFVIYHDTQAYPLYLIEYKV